VVAVLVAALEVVAVLVVLYIKAHFRLLEELAYQYLSVEEQVMSLPLTRLLDNLGPIQHLVR
jgi:hypothetical protein